MLARAFLFVTAVVAVACSAAPEDGVDQSGAEALSRGDVIARAEEWVSAKLPYCQSANHQHDYDSACSSICTRPDNAAWDPYRSDCSGLASFAWGLPAPGRVTKEFAPFVSDITTTIAASDLQPGDAVNNDEHVMLFKSWVTPNAVATFIEEPGCSSSTPYAHEFTSNVSVSGDTIHVAYNGMTFYAIRLKSIHGGGGAAIPSFPNNRVVATKSGNGYWEFHTDGAVYSFGDAGYHGGANTIQHASPILGMARTSTGAGYWQSALDGAVYSFGDATYHGGANTIPHPAPIVGIAASAGSGYWQLAQDGAVYSFGDAAYHGGANGIQHAPMIAITATPSGNGYWMLASDGAIYGYGDAGYHGGANTIPHPAPIVGMAAASNGGYWIVASDGAIYGFGAAYHGGANTIPHPAPIVGIAATASGDGYWLSAGDGAIYSFGDAAYHGGANSL